MDDDSEIDYEKKKRAFLGECFYRYVKVETDLAFILRRSPDKEYKCKDQDMSDAKIVD